MNQHQEYVVAYAGYRHVLPPSVIDLLKQEGGPLPVEDGTWEFSCAEVPHSWVAWLLIGLISREVWKQRPGIYVSPDYDPDEGRFVWEIWFASSKPGFMSAAKPGLCSSYYLTELEAWIAAWEKTP